MSCVTRLCVCNVWIGEPFASLVAGDGRSGQASKILGKWKEVSQSAVTTNTSAVCSRFAVFSFNATALVFLLLQVALNCPSPLLFPSQIALEPSSSVDRAKVTGLTSSITYSNVQ